MRIELQDILDQLSKLTPTELSEVKAAINEELARHLRIIGAHGDLTTEEWERLDHGLIGCIQMVRARTGLGLRDSKAYVDRARTKGRPPIRPGLDNSDLANDLGNSGRWGGSK